MYNQGLSSRQLLCMICNPDQLRSAGWKLCPIRQASHASSCGVRSTLRPSGPRQKTCGQKEETSSGELKAASRILESYSSRDLKYSISGIAEANCRSSHPPTVWLSLLYASVAAFSVARNRTSFESQLMKSESRVKCIQIPPPGTEGHAAIGVTSGMPVVHKSTRSSLESAVYVGCRHASSTRSTQG